MICEVMDEYVDISGCATFRALDFNMCKGGCGQVVTLYVLVKLTKSRCNVVMGGVVLTVECNANMW